MLHHRYPYATHAARALPTREAEALTVSRIFKVTVARADLHSKPMRAAHPTTDYRMASRALVDRVSRGLVAVQDVCDAHPELLRAAANVGQETKRHCPICSLADERAEVSRDEAPALRLVTYVFGDALKKLSGHIVWERSELDELAGSHDSFTAYVIECCLVCGWNHMVESALMGRAHTG